MKLQIDSTQKKITIQEPVNLNEFFEMVKGLFPNDLWKEFTLETNVINNWTSPIIIKEYPVYPQYPINPYPQNPIQPPFIPTAEPWSPNPPFPWITTSIINKDSRNNTIEGTPHEIAMKINNYSLNKGVFNVEIQAKA